MAQNMKLSLITQTGETKIVVVNNDETFAKFQAKLLKEHSLIVSLEDFKGFDANLTFNSNFFNCLKQNLSDEELLNIDSPIYEINLFQGNNQSNIKTEHSSTFNLSENFDHSLIVMNSTAQGLSNILQENIFENFDDTNKNPNQELSFDLLLQASYQMNEPRENSVTSPKPIVNVPHRYIDIESELRQIHNYSQDSITDYCRLCAVNIDDNKIMIYEQNVEYEEQINSSLPIKISREDGLPQQLCELCSVKLEKHFLFMKNVTEADKILKLKFSIAEKSNEQINSTEYASTHKPKKNLKIESNDENSADIEAEYLEVEEIEDVTNSETHHCRICDLILDNLKDALLHSAEDHRINNLYACVFCAYGFETTILLSQHIQTEHKNFNKYICKVCNTRFAYQIMLQKHVCQYKKFQNIKIEYPCEICKKIFNSKTSLLFHKKIHNNKCDICSKIFADKQTLKEHAVLHLETKPFQCHVCGKKLNRLNRLKTHMLTHESNNLIVNDVHCCVDCKEAFENEEKAILHRNVGHQNLGVSKLDKVFRCEFCEKCYITPEALKIHRKIHNKTNPYICHLCNAQFSSYSRCTSHKTSHGLYKEGGDKQIFPVIKYFLCNSCNKTYLNWTHLTSHKKVKHTSNTYNVYKCIDCNLEFPTSWGIAYHRKTKHSEEPIKCTECAVSVPNYEAWKQHRIALHANKKYNYQCVKCSKIFNTQESLEEHLKIHRNIKENKCPYCPSSFVDIKMLAAHLKIHRTKKPFVSQNTILEPPTFTTNDSRPFACDDCGLTFRKQFTLKNHKSKHCTKIDRSKFILMVDMNEDEMKNNQNHSSHQSSPVVRQQQINTTEGHTPQEQYIDIGNGNYVKLQQGNTVNIDGKEYVLVQETENMQTDDENITTTDQLIFDHVQNGDQIIENNQNFDDAVMFIDAESTYMLQDGNNEVSDDLVKTFTHNGTTYILSDQIMVQHNNQTL